MLIGIWCRQKGGRFDIKNHNKKGVEHFEMLNTFSIQIKY
jgi:hypothetical protein